MRSRKGGDGDRSSLGGVFLLLLLGAACVVWFYLLPDEYKRWPPGPRMGTGMVVEKIPSAEMEPQAPEPAVAPLANQAPPTQPAPVVEAKPEPDWRQLAQVLYYEYLGRFSAPPRGAQTEVQLATGIKVKGEIRALTDHEITLQLPQGTLTFLDTQVAKQDRIRFFSKHFARHHALRQLKAEKAAYLGSTGL